ncbi:MAG TPA: hypothetical protein ENN90_15175 [Mariniphaga anaerophila]|uniref:Uncharacterized protein n=1 Tax=Mariniphaga anaerophila TaxID=1484053 RepID=A0A831LT24_9BACT|nr:hypothetical protein [Mariniphaga anaerophila]
MEQKTRLPEFETEEYYQMLFESVYKMVEGLKGMIRIEELNLMANPNEKELNHNIEQLQFFKNAYNHWNNTLKNLQHYKTDVPRQIPCEQPPVANQQKPKRKNWLTRRLFGR